LTVEPGWYYAEGDPPGTVRRWNGQEWIGFPILTQGTVSAQRAEEARAAIPTHHFASLKVPAIFTQLALILLVLA